MASGNIWGGPLNIEGPTEEMRQSWRLRRDTDEGVNNNFQWKFPSMNSLRLKTLATVLVLTAVVILIVVVVKSYTRRDHRPEPDHYTTALRKALMFFNAQRCMLLNLSLLYMCMYIL